MKLLRPFTLSLAFLIVAMALSHYVHYLPRRLLDFLPLLPYVMSGVVIVLALSFHRSRIALLVMLLSFTYWVLRSYPQASWFGHFLPLLALLWPLNILLYGLFRERGLLSISTLLRLGLLLLQFGLVVWILARQPQWLHALLQQTWWPWLAFTGSSFGQLSQLLLLGSLLLSLILAVRTDSWLESGIVVVLVLVGWVLHVPTKGSENLILLSLMPLVLGLVILFDSYRMAYLDELTGLPGRRALREHLGRLVGGYSLAMLDVDHFKKFNDTYGHDIGDQVLRFVAGKMRKVGGGGKAYRYGGEEFTFIFAAKGLDEVMGYLEEVRKDLAESEFAIRGKGRPKAKAEASRGRKAADKYVKITASFGVAQQQEGLSADEVMKRADQALYRAKESGRNRVCK